ncbi:hypothetical protein GUITHDRAFT_134907 [Guillardia theta CCMP2712]|uniref:Uncharacterized protein n=1 Tax=Guillardia theta (strain CCMP2712) TaxID=905079 RepID=L1JQG3_GUITC|nr:hypothetical protein GUITHDRAFT_134907 [Guillardia theta CCMP2712]EKX50791.1 hypothetical protein GUITHDRAFT_134907 [Guillardia theta CCMP2712]|eukprot:XP_005837771.1 hypothetical protein GUITHDRAFT_134907 [Guillardia theta CCMP2712]
MTEEEMLRSDRDMAGWTSGMGKGMGYSCGGDERSWGDGLAARVSKPALKSFKGSKKHGHDGRSLNGENREWQTELKCFVDGKPVPEKLDVKSWDAKVTAAWVASLNDGEFEHNVHRLEEIGIKSFGDRIKISDLIAQLKRRYSKPQTAMLRQPSWPECFYLMLTFQWANTSEGKHGAEMKEELIQANGAIALVSTLTWSMAWDLFFGSATQCYCSTTKPDLCYCSTSWDLGGGPLLIFYCFAGLSAFLFMFSTIYAVLQIMMVYEMSDDEELECFLDLVPQDSLLPGMLCFSVPVGVYLIYNVNLGIVPGPQGPERHTQLVFSYIAAIFSAVISCYGFLYKIPSMVYAVYQERKAKIMAVDDDKTNEWSE